MPYSASLPRHAVFRAPTTYIYKFNIIIRIIVNLSSISLYVLDLELARRPSHFNIDCIPLRPIGVELSTLEATFHISHLEFDEIVAPAIQINNDKNTSLLALNLAPKLP